jgi:hypothetical protein
MTPRSILLHLAGVAALAAVAAIYMRPEVVMMLASAAWTCFD